MCHGIPTGSGNVFTATPVKQVSTVQDVDRTHKPASEALVGRVTIRRRIGALRKEILLRPRASLRFVEGAVNQSSRRV